MIAIWTTLVFTVAALATAMTLGWRKWAREPVRVTARPAETCGCYPKVKR